MTVFSIYAATLAHITTFSNNVLTNRSRLTLVVLLASIVRGYGTKWFGHSGYRSTIIFLRKVPELGIFAIPNFLATSSMPSAINLPMSQIDSSRKLKNNIN